MDVRRRDTLSARTIDSQQSVSSRLTASMRPVNDRSMAGGDLVC